MSLRDEIEHTLRAWNQYEISRNAPSVIDYDCCPTTESVQTARSRLDVYEQFSELQSRADADGDAALSERIGAHLAYLRELLGVRIDLEDYIRATQGCGAAGWPEDYVLAVRETARAHLDSLGIPWSEKTRDQLEHAEGLLDIEESADLIRHTASELEPAVRAAVGSAAEFDLAIEKADIDAYWAFWVDGAGSKVRLRLNARHASFTKVRARQFALHEVLGHGLQGASWSERARRGVDWVRLMTVHAPQQVLLEGLAQALPLFVTPDDKPVIARVRLAHYTELVHAELHLALARGDSLEQCAQHARRRVPWWTAEQISGALTDRGSDPLLRSYLWSYPAGIDWFIQLADRAEPETVGAILRAAYASPFTPNDLASLWDAGPVIGGPPT